jgi:hypothetical protein
MIVLQGTFILLVAGLWCYYLYVKVIEPLSNKEMNRLDHKKGKAEHESTSTKKPGGTNEQ